MIRFLHQWGPYDDQAVVSLGATEEARLVWLGLATYDTSAIPSSPIFRSLSDLPAASEFGPGVAQVGGMQLLSNGVNMWPIPSLILPGSLVTERRYPLPASLSAGATYIDPSKTTNGDGTIGNPMRLSQITTGTVLSSNKAYLFKRGTEFTYDFAAGSGTRSNVVFGAYGEGADPIWHSGASNGLYTASYTSVTIFGIDFRSETASACINEYFGSGATASSKAILGCKFTQTYSGDTTAAVRLYGANSRIALCIFDGIANDAIYSSGNSLDIGYNYIDNVGVYSALDVSPEGDCIQLAGTATGVRIHHNYLRNPSGAKQVVEAEIAGASLIVEDNVIIHAGEHTAGSKTIKSAHTLPIIRRNYIEALQNGVWLTGGGEVYDNYLVISPNSLNSDATDAAIQLVNHTKIYKVMRNLCVAQSGDRYQHGIRYGYANAMSAGSEITDNALIGFNYGILSNNLTVYTETGNKFIDCITDYHDGTNPVTINASSSTYKFDPFMTGLTGANIMPSGQLPIPLDTTGIYLKQRLQNLRIDLDLDTSELVITL